MSKSYEKIAKKIPLATRIEVLEDMAKIDKMEIESLKKELEKVKNLGLANVGKRCYKCNIEIDVNAKCPLLDDCLNNLSHLH